MIWYILRRAVWTVFATFIILSFTFVLMDMLPNNQIRQAGLQAAIDGQNPEIAKEAARERLGLDRPFHVRYWDFMTAVFEGDWGWSTEYEKPVKDVIFNRLPYSAMFAVPAIVLSTILGTAIGLYSAVNQHTKKDYAATFFAFFGVSIPNFWFGIVLLVIFGTFLGWVDIGFNEHLAKSASGDFVWLQEPKQGHPAFIGSKKPTEYVGILSPANLKQLILPVFVLMTGGMASVMRYSRAEALEYVEADFIKTAKSKGVSNRRIVAQHIFRPASVPLMTIFVGRLLGLLFAGALTLELVFSIPGIGLAAYEAIVSQDTDLVAMTILIPTVIVIFGNLLEDIAYAALDPRIDYGDR